MMRMLPHALWEVTKVLTYGHEKHGGDFDGGRMSSDTCLTECEDSLGRHILQELMGEEVDDEVEIIHAAFIAANALIKLELLLKEKKNEQ